MKLGRETNHITRNGLSWATLTTAITLSYGKPQDLSFSLVLTQEMISQGPALTTTPQAHPKS